MLFNFHGLYTDDDKNRFRLAQEEDLESICDYLKTDKSKVADIRFEVFDTREGKQAADPHHSISRASARFNEMALYRVWTPDDDPQLSSRNNSSCSLYLDKTLCINRGVRYCLWN